MDGKITKRYLPDGVLPHLAHMLNGTFVDQRNTYTKKAEVTQKSRLSKAPLISLDSSDMLIVPIGMINVKK